MSPRKYWKNPSDPSRSKRGHSFIPTSDRVVDHVCSLPGCAAWSFSSHWKTRWTFMPLALMRCAVAFQELSAINRNQCPQSTEHLSAIPGLRSVAHPPGRDCPIYSYWRLSPSAPLSFVFLRPRSHNCPEKSPLRDTASVPYPRASDFPRLARAEPRAETNNELNTSLILLACRRQFSLLIVVSSAAGRHRRWTTHTGSRSHWLGHAGRTR
jgi:hypothetical protein